MGLGIRGANWKTLILGVLVEEEDDADRDLPGFGAEGGVVFGCSIALEEEEVVALSLRIVLGIQLSLH
ncbi:hypothetical protein DTO027B5_3096 [Paecilomyces variotii]|nr:hypothetical protein DTO021C3_6590 [Paecilomyces variotii]KAJ9319873.1 hypothetical protein DTO027B3_9101 [Paecilomyces variotii]KAJ9335133.1 hypothetical protein DTO027B5_3096 [Paecilomyces variotii]